MKYYMTGPKIKWAFKTGGRLIEVTPFTGLTVYIYIYIYLSVRLLIIRVAWCKCKPFINGYFSAVYLFSVQFNFFSVFSF